jgi:chaperonin GroES
VPTRQVIREGTSNHRHDRRSTEHERQTAARPHHCPAPRGRRTDTAKEKPQQGKVIAAGNGKNKDDGKRIPLDVKAGDLILFGKYSGQEIKLDGEEYLIMREDEVLAVIEDKKKK